MTGKLSTLRPCKYFYMFIGYCISTVVHWNIPAPWQLATVKKLSMYLFVYGT